jgi:hypothetical protein
LNGPDPTGFGLVKVAGSATFDQMCFGTTNARFSVAPMNCESGLFRVMATPYLPLALIEAMLLPAPVIPIRSIVLSCRPARRL